MITIDVFKGAIPSIWPALLQKLCEGEISPTLNIQISGALALTEAKDLCGQDLPDDIYSSKIRGRLEKGQTIITERTILSLWP